MTTLAARLDRLESAGYGGPEIVHVVVAEVDTGTGERWEHQPTAEERSIVEEAIRQEGLKPVAVWKPDDSPESVLAALRGQAADMSMWRAGR